MDDDGGLPASLLQNMKKGGPYTLNPMTTPPSSWGERRRPIRRYLEEDLRIYEGGKLNSGRPPNLLFPSAVYIGNPGIRTALDPVPSGRSTCDNEYPPGVPLLYLLPGQRYDICLNSRPKNESVDGKNDLPCVYEPPEVEGRFSRLVESYIRSEPFPRQPWPSKEEAGQQAGACLQISDSTPELFANANDHSHNGDQAIEFKFAPNTSTPTYEKTHQVHPPRRRKAKVRRGLEDSEGKSTKDSKKVLIACYFCRGRKLKCSGNKPKCNNCANRPVVCEYATHPKRRGKGKAPTGTRSKKRNKADERVDAAGPSSRKRVSEDCFEYRGLEGLAI